MVETYLEKFIKNAGAPPMATEKMVRSVSKYRREILEEEVAQGKFRERGNTGYSSPHINLKSDAGTVIGSSMNKTASFSSSGGGNSWGGSGGTVRQAPEIYSPLWLNSNINLPRDNATINAWSRAFMALNPIVQNAITLHSTYPISKLNITCKDEKIQQFFQDMSEEIGLMNICSQIAQEYWVLGEAFPYAELDETTGKWSRIILQNPDYVAVKNSAVAGEPVLSLRPDENLKRIVNSNRPTDLQQKQRLDRSIIEHVKRGENIPLSNFYASHIARRLSPQETRGTSLIVSCFRSLMLYDKLNESKFAQSDNMINPLTLVKVGAGADGFKPSQEDLEAYRQVFEQATYDKDFKIFTHDAVTVERIGYGAGIIDVAPDMERLTKEIYIGLFIPQVLMDGGGDVTYANGGITLDVLKQRYFRFRNMLSDWLRTKIFAPISKINEFYEYKDGKKVLIVPEIEWNHMSLFDAGDYISTLTTLRSADPENKEVSLQTIYKSLGLDYKNERRQQKMEAIDDAIFTAEKLALKGYTLNELRNLGPDDAIEMKDEDALPGEQENDQEGGAGGGGIDLGLPGGAPDLGGGLEGPPGLPPEGGVEEFVPPV